MSAVAHVLSPSLKGKSSKLKIGDNDGSIPEMEEVRSSLIKYTAPKQLSKFDSAAALLAWIVSEVQSAASTCKSVVQFSKEYGILGRPMPDSLLIVVITYKTNSTPAKLWQLLSF